MVEFWSFYPFFFLTSLFSTSCLDWFGNAFKISGSLAPPAWFKCCWYQGLTASPWNSKQIGTLLVANKTKTKRQPTLCSHLICQKCPSKEFVVFWENSGTHATHSRRCLHDQKYIRAGRVQLVLINSIAIAQENSVNKFAFPETLWI